MEERKPLNSASALNVEDSDSRSRHHSTAKKLNVTFLARGWNELRDETEIIKEIAKYMAKSSEVTITIIVPECNDEDKEAAKRQNINLVMADKKIGFARLDFLSWAPKEMSIDIVVGSDIELGRHASAIRDSRSPDCKWVQFVHRSHEDIEKHKENSNRTETEEKHNIEVQLCKSSDYVVTIGPKVHETFCSYLRPYEKDEHVYNFTPGIMTELSGLRQSQKELKYFRVVCFFSGDLKDFDLQGLDIAAEAVATLRDCRLLFVGALDGMQDETKKRFVECGIDPKFFVIRSVIHTQEKLKKVLLEADLAIMPSREEGFGFKLLKALSAGLPILVSSNSGLAEALRRIPFGPNFVVSSDDSGAWAEAIDSIRKKDRCTRLKESGKLRLLYQEMYSWEKQCKTLLQNIIRLPNGMNFDNDHDDHGEHHYDAEEETENPQAGESILARRPVQNFGSRTSKGATAKLANESPSVNKEIAADGDVYGDTAVQNFGSRTSKGATAKLANESPSVKKQLLGDVCKQEVILPFMARNSLRLASFFLPRERWTTTVVVFASVMLFIWAKENGTKAGFLSFLFAASVITLNSALRALALRLNFRSDTFQIKYARYQGDWKDYNRWYILIPTIASALILCYTFFELNEVLSRPLYAATLFSFCFVVPQWLFFADILDKEREIKNFADVLAWNYYLEYLELVLPRLEEQIYRSYQFSREINCKKLFILLPKNCHTHGLISDADPKVKLVGRLPAVNINWAGISQRSYQHTVYRIETLAPGGKVRESAPFVMEYATPLVSMYNMSYYNDSLITPLERDHLMTFFTSKLSEILDECPKCRGRYRLVLIPKDDDDKIADILVKIQSAVEIDLEA